jgi:hypothetical protein
VLLDEYECSFYKFAALSNGPTALSCLTGAITFYPLESQHLITIDIARAIFHWCDCGAMANL